MSNVKRVLIAGDVPFDLGGGNEDGGGSKNLRDCVLQFAMPTVGVRIEYGSTSRQVPTPGGGLYSMISFVVSGEEALSSAFLQKFCSSVWDVGGQVALFYEYDVENGAELERIAFPEVIREIFRTQHDTRMLRVGMRKVEFNAESWVPAYP